MAKRNVKMMSLGEIFAAARPQRPLGSVESNVELALLTRLSPRLSRLRDAAHAADAAYYQASEEYKRRPNTARLQAKKQAYTRVMRVTAVLMKAERNARRSLMRRR